MINAFNTNDVDNSLNIITLVNYMLLIMYDRFISLLYIFYQYYIRHIPRKKTKCEEVKPS